MNEVDWVYDGRSSGGAVSKTLLVVLIGRKETGQIDHYQLLQEEEARVEAEKAKMTAEIVFAPGFDHLRVIRKRFTDPAAPRLDAVIVEPASVASTGLILKELKGKAGLVLLNAWTPDVEGYAANWGASHPFGTVSTDHERIGRIQGQQVAALLPKGGQVLCVTGPQRSSAALERLQGMKAGVRSEVSVYDTESGQWTQSDAIVAFDSWYSLYKTRSISIDVIAAQSDELAIGVRNACRAVTNAAHREMLLKARLLGVDGCPDFGRKLVDSGELFATVVAPANSGEAIRLLRQFWESGRALPLRAVTEPKPYPAQSAA
jgi:ribose transport system substrate-binding protein